MDKTNGLSIPDGWLGPNDRIEIRRDVERRGAEQLFDWFGDQISVDNEQAAWLRLHDEYRAQMEASGMPPEIADSLGELLDDGGGILLAPGDSGFVLLKPDGNGMRFGTKTDGDGHRVMDISELNPDEMADALSKVDQKTLVEVVVRMTTQRLDLDGASCLVDAWVGLSQASGLELAAVFRNGLDRELITPERLQAAVDEAVDETVDGE